jgi:hypothetical protein
MSNVIPFRLAKDGSDKDIEKHLKNAKVKTQRIKELMRYGIKYEALLNLGFDQKKLEDLIPFSLNEHKQPSVHERQKPSTPRSSVLDEIKINIPNVKSVTYVSGNKMIRKNILAGFD